ncbi:MAG: DUF6290 family protein [Firmicutes bacterium]|nr:DUF6290 family protein [Bacillota bacterium]
MSITLRVNPDEMAVIKSYADLRGITVSDAIRTAILERIEDELDVKLATQAYAEWEKDGKRTISLSEVKGELGLKE